MARLDVVGAKTPGTSTDVFRLEVEGEICQFLVMLAEPDELQKTVRMERDARQLGAGWPAEVPKSLDRAGQAFARIEDWKSAANYYGRSLAEWAKLPEAV